jgi:hypothetical protein
MPVNHHQITLGLLPQVTNEAYAFLLRSIDRVLALANCFWMGQSYLAFINSFCVVFMYVRRHHPRTC